MIPLEDNFADIIGKAQHGLRLSDSELAEKARVNSQTLRKLRDGEFDELALLRVAPVLGLSARALCELATGVWKPDKLENFDGLAQFSTSYGGMMVNSYLVGNPDAKRAPPFSEVRLSWGHLRGGMSYVVTGLARPIAIVGDSLFAGSMGGGNVSYNDAVRNNLEKILTLPEETIICPGHGPMTTVREEKQHNPFFAGKL